MVARIRRAALASRLMDVAQAACAVEREARRIRETASALAGEISPHTPLRAPRPIAVQTSPVTSPALPSQSARLAVRRRGASSRPRGVGPRPPRSRSSVVDLMTALKRSLDDGGVA